MPPQYLENRLRNQFSLFRLVVMNWQGEMMRWEEKKKEMWPSLGEMNRLYVMWSTDARIITQMNLAAVCYDEIKKPNQ